MKLVMKRSHLEEIIRHAKDEFPREACGLLAGEENKVNRVYRMANVESTPLKYSMDLKEQFKVVKDMRSQDLSLVGIYHSHPNVRPSPSLRDIESALQPEVSYVIVSLIGNLPEVRSFRIRNGVAMEEEIDVS